MPPGRILPVFGISGVGKSSLINRIATENSRFIQISASTVIEAISAFHDTKRAESKGTRKTTLLRIQEIAVREILKISKISERKFVILDAHNVIDVGDDLVQIPVQVFESLSPMQLFFVYDDPKEIEKRRIGDTTRRRPQRRASKLADCQNIALDTAQTYARVLGIHLTQIKSGDLMAFRTAIDASIKNAAARIDLTS